MGSGTAPELPKWVRGASGHPPDNDNAGQKNMTKKMPDRSDQGHPQANHDQVGGAECRGQVTAVPTATPGQHAP